MNALGLLAPTTLFGSPQTAIGNLTVILGAFKALGPTATVAEIAGATTALEKLGAVGAMAASYYIGAVKGQPRQARVEGFNPVPHTADDTARLLANPTVKAAYDALEDEYTALRAILP